MNAPDSGSREKVNYNSAQTPVYIHTSRLSDPIYGPNMSAMCHWHEDIEFICILDGHMNYRVNGTEYRLEAGNGIFVNSRQLHYGFSPDRNDCGFLCVVLNPLLLCATPYIEQQFITALTENRSFPMKLLTPETEWERMLMNLLLQTGRACAERVPGYELELQSLFNRIWLLLYRNMPSASVTPPTTSSDMTAMKNMIRYIETHLTSRIRLKDIALAGQVCQSRCCSIFRRYLNRTPIEYVTEYRLQEGRRLLSETDLNITEIADRAGFSGASYFSERFRQYYNCSPVEYRKQGMKH